MASFFIGSNRGAVNDTNPDTLTVGTSTGSTDVELRYDTGKSLTRADIYNFMERVEKYLLAANIASTNLQL